MKKVEGLKNELSYIYDVVEIGELLYRDLTICEKQDLTWTIPPYQRGYSWDIKNFDDFIETMEELSNRGGIDTKYFGQIILLASQGESTLEVIDGQQRLTTYLILAKVMLELYEDMDKDDYNPEDCTKLEKYLYLDNGEPRFRHQSKNRRVIEEYIYLLKPNARAEINIRKLYEEYKQHLENDAAKRAEYRKRLHEEYVKQSCELKKADYNSIILGYSILKEFCEEKTKKPKKFHNFEQNLISSPSITTSVLVAKEFETAYESFMSLNGKGRSLTTFDLVKSEFIGSLDGKVSYNIETDWDSNVDVSTLTPSKLVEILDIMLKIEYNEFYFVFISKERSSKRTFLRDILSEIKKQYDAQEIYEKYKTYIDNYCKMKDGKFSEVLGSKSFTKFDDEVKSTLNMNYIPFQPLLFEVINETNKQNEDWIKIILNVIRYVPFIYVTVCGLRPSHLSNAMSEYLKNSKQSDDERLKKIKDSILNKKVKEAFKLNLREATIKNHSVSKDVLLLLEGMPEGNKYLNELEHIYPQNAKSKQWENINKNYLNLIGNHVIVSKEMNQKMDNLPYSKKMEVLQEEFSQEVLSYVYLSKEFQRFKDGNQKFDKEDVLRRGKIYTEELTKKFEEMNLF